MSDAFIDAVKNDDVQGAKQYVFDALQVKIADSFNNITSDAISAFGFSTKQAQQADTYDETPVDITNQVSTNEE